jgi:hypothetical protein
MQGAAPVTDGGGGERHRAAGLPAMIRRRGTLGVLSHGRAPASPQRLGRYTGRARRPTTRGDAPSALRQHVPAKFAHSDPIDTPSVLDNREREVHRNWRTPSMARGPAVAARNFGG